MNYPVVDLPDESGTPVQYYRVVVHNAAVLYVQKSMIDSGETTVEAEIQSLLEPHHA